MNSRQNKFDSQQNRSKTNRLTAKRKNSRQNKLDSWQYKINSWQNKILNFSWHFSCSCCHCLLLLPCLFSKHLDLFVVVVHASVPVLSDPFLLSFSFSLLLFLRYDFSCSLLLSVQNIHGCP